MAEQENARTSSAATKVQEAAASVQRATSGRRKRISGEKAEAVVRRYFQAVDAHKVDEAAAMWAPDGREDVRGQGVFIGPEGVREFIGGLIEAVPDMRMEIVETTTQDERCVAHWRLTGTFAGPGTLSGVAPTGDRLELEGLDMLSVRDGLIQSNDAFTDTLELTRQIGMMPAQGSPAEQRMMGAFNVKTRVLAGLAGTTEPKLVAEGVWCVQGQPGRCNVYMIEDDGAITMFDAGARTMSRSVASAGARLGGIKRIVLGHAHTDHRGSAPGLGVPVLCHPDEVQDAEGSGGFRYWPADLAGVPPVAKQIHKVLHRFAFDGGPVSVAGTVREGDEVAGFRVIELPGHAPGQIGLWRERDRLALVSDCFDTIDLWGRNSAPHAPFETYSYDSEQARASMRKLAEMEPAAAWPGHGNPITGDVRGQLLAAAGEPQASAPASASPAAAPEAA
ncbi:MAG TPA: nuclear transport factor 2 family protein [Solirubrobacteraceae bacterium]|nr:nuclear transport factor 2 family protein [Solirubrobacteraceae bacterium]